MRDARRLLAHHHNELPPKQVDFLHLPIVDGRVTADSLVDSFCDKLIARVNAGQGLALVHFSAIHEPFSSLKLHDTTQLFPQKVLTLSRKVDECMPLMRGSACTSTAGEGTGVRAPWSPSCWVGPHLSGIQAFT